MGMRVGRPGYQREMQFIYTSSHRGKGNTQLVSNLYRMDYLCKNKTLKTEDSEFHYTSPVIPACDNARQWPLGMRWWELMYGRKSHKSQKFVKNPSPPIHTHSDT